MPAKKKTALRQSNQDRQTVFDFLDFSHLPVEQKFVLANGVGSWIHSEFLLRVVRALNDDHIQEFIALAEREEKNQEALLNFLKKAIPNIDMLLEESKIAVRANIMSQKNIQPVPL